MYRSHAPVVAAIRTELGVANAKQLDGLKLALLRERLARELEKVTVLTALCGELALTLHDAQQELIEMRASLKRRERKDGRS